MSKAFKLAMAGLLAATVSVPAMATVFTGTYTTTAHSSGNGLLIQTTPGAQNISFDIEQGGPSYTNNKLFRIWTDEGSVNFGEDTTPKAFTLTFNFDSPAFDGIAN